VFERVTIVGVGLLGTSLGLALKARGLAGEILGVGRPGSASLHIAQDRGAIDRAFTSLADAVAAQPDLVILCTPVRQFPQAFRTLHGKLRHDAIVTDVGSTKAEVMTWAAEGLSSEQDAVFVGSHPMAGNEKRGPAAARPDLYHGGLCLICPAASASAGGGGGGRDDRADAAPRKIEALWEFLGMRTLRLAPAVHDRWVATVSHLPHAIAFALMSTAAGHPEMLAAAAGGLFDTTRIASSDTDMWTDIFLTNRDAVLGALEEFSATLATLKAAIAAGNEPALRAALLHAKSARDDLLLRRP
jgi:prephenate dehydrogenase